MPKRTFTALLLGLSLTCLGTGAPGLAAAASKTFTNPVITSQDAPDPWVIRVGRRYFFTATLEPEGGLWVWASSTLSGLDSAKKVKVWTAPKSGLMSHQIWAPELHHFGQRWYLYFTASDGSDANHRQYVLESLSGDPQGRYKAPVRVDPSFESYAIDGSVLRLPNGKLYWMYCAGGVWIAPMSSPTQVSGPAVPLITGSEDWEHAWTQVNGEWVKDQSYWVEAPEALIHDGRVFVAYSAGHTAAKYFLGLMELRGKDPLAPDAWVKHKGPLFGPYQGPDGAVYAPGHNSFTTSPDGRQNWLVYHGKDQFAGDFAGRTTRIQPFSWNKDGTPKLGRPIPSGVRQLRPAGE